MARRNGARVLTLYGDMAPDEQDEVLRPNRRGTGGPRRVILSTPIAESSVTIDGVTAVVDSGLRRVPYYDASTAINRLVTVRVPATGWRVAARTPAVLLDGGHTTVDAPPRLTPYCLPGRAVDCHERCLLHTKFKGPCIDSSPGVPLGPLNVDPTVVCW